MDFSIRPATPAGERYVELCEEHAADFATREYIGRTALGLGSDVDL